MNGLLHVGSASRAILVISSVVGASAVGALLAGAGCARGGAAAEADSPPLPSAPRVCGETEAGPSPAPLLIGRLSLSRTHIAFSYAGSVWLVERAGGEARRLPGPADAATDNPAFSPDGSSLAFSRQVDGNWDVYAMPAAGGEPRRLTFHPSWESVMGWTPDGKRVLFSSNRTSPRRRLFTIQADGGAPLPSELPLPRAGYGSFSADGARIAYTPMSSAVDSWRFYRGGDQGLIWLVDLADGALEELPRGEWNDLVPMWIGQRIYFLSDRTGTYNLYSRDLARGTTRPLTAFAAHGIRAAAAAGDAVAFVCDGRIHLHDIASGKTRAVAVTAAPEIDELAPRTVDASHAIEGESLSREGDKVILSARGDVFLLEPSAGRARNLTATPGAAERDGALSPDGRRVAYFSDASGDYQLHVRELDGAVKAIDIEPEPSFYRELVWSPDSTKVAFIDKRLAIWIADLERGAVKRIDRSPYSHQEEFTPSWSPDSRFLAYAKHLRNRVRTIFIHDVAAGVNHQVTDGRTQAESPVFDRSGSYLYFLSSPNAGLGEFGWGVLNAVVARPLVTRRAHLLVLRRDRPAPLLPDGSVNPEARAEAPNAPVKIDFDGLERRVVDLPLEPRDFARLIAGPAGRVYAVVREWPASSLFDADPSYALFLHDRSKPAELTRVVDRLDRLAVSGDGAHLLYAAKEEWFLARGDGSSDAARRQLDLAGLRFESDPRAEARQMTREAWRIMRDWFYDPGHHGQDLAALERHYAAYLPSIRRAADLTELMNRMLGHVSVGHLRVGGPSASEAPRAPRTGLLGADYDIQGGRYRLRRVYRSTSHASPAGAAQAPLDRPGFAVRDGDYLLEVEGAAVDPARSVDSYLQGRAGQATRVRIGSSPDGAGARTLTVFPLADEGPLRLASWAEANRRRVDEMSGGKLGYIYAANYGSATMDFIRGLLAYSDRAGIVIDQRHNGGGITPDYLIEWLRRRPLYYYMFREGDDIATPVNPGPPVTVLVVNEDNFSAAETFAFMYQLARVGPIVGMRTGGGGIGPYVFTPRLLDGSRIQIPNRAAFRPDGTSFGIENIGIRPDREVAITPRDLLAGRDPQLDEAVRVALARVAATPPPAHRRPSFPVHRSRE
jgi:tricorn protease